jgi:pyruvate/2-oxoglutarate/acetoin dehydrogenase E1 component
MSGCLHHQTTKEIQIMNIKIVYNPNTSENVLNELAKELPVIISETLEVAGGKVAILKQDQVALEFSRAETRDTGADIRIMVYARDINPRTSASENQANTILERIIPIITGSGSKCSVNVRLYFMEIRAAEYAA